VEAGRIGLSIEPVRLGEAVLETLALIRPLAAARSISVGYQGDQAFETYVRADRQRLKQVMLNLLSNAVKYNREGGSVVVTSTVDDGVVSVAVTDTGPGIEPEQLERLFVPFERLGAEATGEEGTGLGLTLSRNLSEAMGGVLDVSSTPGQGSTFTLSLPSSPAPLDMPGVAMAMSDPDGARPVVNLHSVLYIEDNIASISLVEQILALRPGLSLETAMQGRLGLSLAREHRPDLILLDLNLADVSGREVLAELKVDPRTRPIPVLMISADASPGQIQRLLDGGAAGYLTKPLDVPQFLGEVDRLLHL
jgi:CheY-like chemotaxis protein